MKYKIGRLIKTHEGEFRLSYKNQEDAGYVVTDKQPQYKIFPSKVEANNFIVKNNIKLID